MPFVSRTWSATLLLAKTRLTVCSATARRVLWMTAILGLLPFMAPSAFAEWPTGDNPVRHDPASNSPASQNTAYEVQQINVTDSAGTYAQGVNRQNHVVGYAQVYVEKNGVNTEETEGFVYRNGTYQTLWFPFSNGSTRAFGISDASEIVGDFLGRDGYTHGFLHANGKYTQYDLALGSASTSIFGVNDGGAFVGTVGNEGFVNIGGTVTKFYGSGTDLTYANAINDSNLVVGQFQDSSGNWHGFSFDVGTGTVTEIDYPGALQTVVVGVNDAGVISGWYQNSQGSNVSFVEANGTFETVDFFSETNGISNAGSFVGSYFGSEFGISVLGEGQMYGYLATPHPMTNISRISVPGAASTSLYGVNNAGHMVGSYTDVSGNTHGLLIIGSKQTTIDYPGADTTVLYDINDSGDIVGYTNAGVGAFWYSNGVFVDLNPPGADNAVATGISDSQLIVGFADYIDVFGNFSYNGSTYGGFGGSDGPVTYGWGVNDSGVATVPWLNVWNSAESSVTNINTGTATRVDVPGASGTVVHSINNLGDVVFTWSGGIGTHSAILKNSTFTYYVFDQPNDGTAANGGYLDGYGPQGFVGAFGINDRDLIVGSFQKQPSVDGSSGATGGFIVQF